MSPTVRMPSSALLGLQTLFIPSEPRADGSQWDGLDCQLGTPVGELRRTAAEVLGVSLRTPLPSPATTLPTHGASAPASTASAPNGVR